MNGIEGLFGKNKRMHTKDCEGETVTLGSIVRVIAIREEIFDQMSEDEVRGAKSMLHNELKVEEIDDNGNAWVWKNFSENEGGPSSHAMALAPSQMKLVSGKSNQGDDE